MFSASALKAMSAEEAQDIAERSATSEANVAETSTAAATATVEAASADADLGSQGLPAQQFRIGRGAGDERARANDSICM